MQETREEENVPIITSKDGYNSYLLIIDRVMRYMWVSLASSKEPATIIARKFLRKFKSKNKHRTVNTDQGRDLGRSAFFSKMIHDKGFNL